MISYAQNHEDVLLNRAFAGQSTGFYVDVGANDPVVLSVTKHFSLLGWRGINIEPGTAPYRRLCADRPRDVNLNLGIAETPGELSLFECPENDALSTFSAEQAEEHRGAGHTIVARTVPVRTLDEICQEHVTGTIDFLTIDVEGFEQQVLSGANLAKWHPRVIVVEATRPSTTEQTHGGWESILLEAGYQLACFDGLNRFYVRGEEPELLERLAVPVNITDRFQSYEDLRLRKQLDEKELALQRMTGECRQLGEQIHGKQAAIEEQEAAIREKEAAIHRLDSTLKRQVETQTQLVADLRSVQAQLQAKDADLARAWDLCQTLREALQAKHAALETALSDSDRLQHQLREKEDVIGQFLSTLQQRSTTSQETLKQAQAALQEKHQALHTALAQAAALREQLEEKHIALHAALDRCQQLLSRSLWERVRNVA